MIRRHYSQAWGQAGLTILGLGLGVSVFISIHLAVGACLSSFKSTVQAVSGLAQWQIIQEGRGLEEGLFPVIKTHPAVQAAAPVVELQVPLQNHPGLVLWIMGVDFFNEAQVRTHAPSLTSLREPDFLSLLLTPQAIALSRDLARRLSVQPGSSLGVLINGRPQTLTVAALIDPEGPARALGGHFGVMDIAQAQEIMGKIGRLDRIDLVLNPEYPVAATIESLQKMLPPGASLLQPSDRQAGTERMVRSYQLNLLALSFIAVLVSMYLMYNVTALSVVRRRKDLGILRSLGMLPNQILHLILWESAGYGLVGGLLGIGGGYLLARVILGTISQTISDLYVLVGVTEIPFILPEMALFLVGAVGVALAFGLRSGSAGLTVAAPGDHRPGAGDPLPTAIPEGKFFLGRIGPADPHRGTPFYPALAGAAPGGPAGHPHFDPGIFVKTFPGHPQNPDPHYSGPIPPGETPEGSVIWAISILNMLWIKWPSPWRP